MFITKVTPRNPPEIHHIIPIHILSTFSSSTVPPTWKSLLSPLPIMTSGGVYPMDMQQLPGK